MARARRSIEEALRLSVAGGGAAMAGASWEAKWAAGIAPGQSFDARRCEPAFEKLLASAADLPRGRALVPGRASLR